MTYEMKIEEERELAREEGENKLARLISCLLDKGNVEEAKQVATDVDKRQQLYIQYGIS